MAGQAQLEQARLEAELEARARADQMLQGEIERARVEASARLDAEIAAVRADAERQRVAELAEIRAHLAEAEEHAAAQARSAAAGMISTQVARAEASIQMATRVAPRPGRPATASTKRVAGKTISRTGSLRQAWDRIPTYTLPTAAGILLAASAMGLLNPLSSDSRAVPVAPSASDAAATSADDRAAARSADPNQRTQETRPRRASRRPRRPQRIRCLPQPRDGGAETAEVPEADASDDHPGRSGCFSRVPLEIQIGDRRIGSSEEEIALPPGRHQLRLVNARLGYQADVAVDVRSSALTTHIAALPQGQVQVVAPAGSEIWIEGKLVGVAPLGVMTVPLGTQAIEVKHPRYGDGQRVRRSSKRRGHGDQHRSARCAPPAVERFPSAFTHAAGCDDSLDRFFNARATERRDTEALNPLFSVSPWLLATWERQAR